VPIITEEIAMTAIELVSPAIQAAFDTGVANKACFSITIGVVKDDGSYKPLAVKNFNEEDWGRRYDQIAHAKAVLSARTGKSSREVQLMSPNLLEVTDVMYWGSAVSSGIVVAGSGVQPWIDEAISAAALAFCNGLVNDWVETRRAFPRLTMGFTITTSKSVLHKASQRGRIELRLVPSGRGPENTYE
jgi:hypothetical protein